MNEKKFINQIGSALVHFLYNFIIYFVFIVPFDLWKKATVRLANQKEDGSLKISNIKSKWPFLSFLKTFILDFLIDGFIFIVYFIGFLAAIAQLIQTKDFGGFIQILISTYFMPIILSLTRDFLQLCILPFKKFLSWVSKPAQFMNLEIKND